MKETIYLAGPFFNPIQLSHAKFLKDTLRNRGYEIFAPVDEFYEEGSKLIPQRIFSRNMKWMNDCNIGLCQLDYPLCNGHRVCIEQYGKIIKHIELPDSGTIWEMGYLKATNKIVIGYTALKVEKINLMLAQGMDGFVENPLDIFLEDEVKWNLIKRWTGEQL